MPLTRPYPNIYRHGPGDAMQYYVDQWKSPEAIKCFKAYELLKDDLREVLDYIEPAAANLATYSHRTFELLLRACTEVESLCRQVFSKNRVALDVRANMARYSDLNGVMRLSDYEIMCFEFDHPPIRPFSSFAVVERRQRSPEWYRAYNTVKHDREASFSQAKLEHVINAVAAVYALLTGQYGLGFDHVISLSPTGNLIDRPDMFRARDLPRWPAEDTYEFQWNEIKHLPNSEAFHAIPVIA